MSAKKIIAKFGNSRRLALAIGKRASVVQYWKKVGYIPPRNFPDIREAAFRMGIPLVANDFVPEFQTSHTHDVGVRSETAVSAV
jgi:hypothetical protein